MGVAREGGYQGSAPRNPPGPAGEVAPMRGEMIKNKNVGPRGSLLQAPAGGSGADFKTTASWGGRSSPPGPNASSASAAKRLVLPNGSVVEVPGGLSARINRRGDVVYHVDDRGAALRLVAELLYRVSRSYRGSVAYLDNRRMVSLLGLRRGGNGHLDAYSSSWVRGILALLGFEEVRRGRRGKAIMIDMGKPIMKEIKSAKSINEVVEIVKRYLR